MLRLVTLVLKVNVKSIRDKHSTSFLIRLECPVANTRGQPLLGKCRKIRGRSCWKLEGRMQIRDDLVQVFTGVAHGLPKALLKCLFLLQHGVCQLLKFRALWN